MKYQDWQKRPERFKAMTGCGVEEFNRLLPLFEEAHNKYLGEYATNRKRRRGYLRYAMYKNALLPCVAEWLAFILSYLKLNPLQEQHAEMFNIEQKQCYEFVHGLKIIMHTVWSVKFPVRRTKADSGKKKRHTVKNIVIVSACCTALYVSQTVTGRVHDRAMAGTACTIPAGFTLYKDSGYQAYRPDGIAVIQPQREPRGKDLTREQRERNRSISSVRVRVEHAIGSIKRYRIAKNECRLRRNDFVGSIFATCAALHNFRLLDAPFYSNTKIN